MTQSSVAAGGQRTYEFTAQHAGTNWFHPHKGAQLDCGPYAPLIVDDPHEPLHYDDEWVVVLDDWLDGVTGTQDDVLAELKRGMGSPSADASSMPGMDMGGMDTGTHTYPYFLLNGRRPNAPLTHGGKPGARLRLRIINAGGDTAFRLALGGHQMTVTHADGYPVQPFTKRRRRRQPAERSSWCPSLSHAMGCGTSPRRGVDRPPARCTPGGGTRSGLWCGQARQVDRAAR
ncbi:MAG: multicopper oxidase [Actinoplanes sp.]|nr:multicopper oxidase [Actinoplanes sp.]